MSFEKGGEREAEKERMPAGRTDDVTAAMGNLHAWREKEEKGGGEGYGQINDDCWEGGGTCSTTQPS